MKKHGLLGRGLSHSLSPDIHKYVYKLIDYDADYKLLDFDENELEKYISLLRKGQINGVNVTMPYKKSIMKYLDYIDEDAQLIGAVNTVLVSNSKLSGYNTDYYGIEMTLKNYMPLDKKNFLILGSGGASKALLHFLSKNNADKIYIASRNKDGKNNFTRYESQIIYINYEEIKNIKASIVFNASPLGMYPNKKACPLKDEFFKNFDSAIDLIYNPWQSLFLKKAKKEGLKTENGFKMLVFQALKSIELWSGKKISSKIKLATYLHFRNLYVEDEKIFLVGMPACGKSSLGKILAQNLSYQFIDLDLYIEEKMHMSIKDIFALYGEKKFRILESQALEEVTSYKKVVIATGGGCVLSEKNRNLLKKYPLVFFINRPCEEILENVNLEDRPLLKDNPEKIFNLYKERVDLYREVSSHILENSESLDVLVKKILLIF